jgi:hypothetical protein
MARTAKISKNIWSPGCAVLVVLSYRGATSTTSPPTRLHDVAAPMISAAPCL